LARDSALVVNLEFIKCIITTDYVLVLNPGDSDTETAQADRQSAAAIASGAF